MRISDWSSDVCSSDLLIDRLLKRGAADGTVRKGVDPLQLYVSMVALSYFHLSNGHTLSVIFRQDMLGPTWLKPRAKHTADILRSEEHTSELQSLMRISYAVFCLKKKKNITQPLNLHK